MIEVTTQKQLDAALKKTNDGLDEEVRCVGDGEFKVTDSSRVSAYDSSTVYASGSSRVYASGSSRVSAYDSSTVSAYGSSRVCAYDSSTVYASGSSRVYASGSSTVYAYDSSRVSAYGSSTVCAYDSSTVYAYDSSTVYAYDSSTVYAKSRRATITATEHVAIHLLADGATATGGVQITPPEPKPITPVEAIERWLLPTEDGKVRLFKAVDDDLKSGRKFAYPIGETVEALDWHDRPECGGGLHLSPTPHHATKYHLEATRWLECEVEIEDLAMCSTHESFPDKIKARRVRVIREVAMNGAPA